MKTTWVEVEGPPTRTRFLSGSGSGARIEPPDPGPEKVYVRRTTSFDTRIRRVRTGRMHHCRLDPKRLRRARDVIARLTDHWNERLDALEKWLEEGT